ncbi:MAG: hypothetical protein MSS98_05600 [Alphaproteobacteria bacterium]|nr:hypothetical protein [Alphaproteobacteria bacterium]
MVSVFSASSISVILRRYSLLEVPRRRIHNAIAKAMSIFNNTPHSALSCHSLPQGAREQRSVAYGNKVMDTRLPQPAGCGDKYDTSELGCKKYRSQLNETGTTSQRLG